VRIGIGAAADSGRSSLIPDLLHIAFCVERCGDKTQ
jgi:hypothetical protein